MAKQANMRWIGFTGGERIPKRGKAKKWAFIKQSRKIKAKNGPVTTRKATKEELERLK